MANKHMKRCWLSGKYKLKQMQGSCPYLSDYLKGRGDLSPQMQTDVWENVEKLEFSYTADWNINWYN